MTRRRSQTTHRPPFASVLESVWDFPSNPAVEPSPREIEIVGGGITIAWTIRAQRVIERGYPPVYYIPAGDVRHEFLIPTHKMARCKWKGLCRYYHLLIGERSMDFASWTYERPGPNFGAIHEHFAFYAHLMDGCYIDAERVQPQSGDFYGGWITTSVAGPFIGDEQ